MTDYDDIIWCPKCKDSRVFNMAGSGTKGICMVCEYEVRGMERIKRLQDCLAFDFMLAPMSNEIDK